MSSNLNRKEMIEAIIESTEDDRCALRKLWVYSPEITPREYHAFFDRMHKKTDETLVPYPTTPQQTPDYQIFYDSIRRKIFLEGRRQFEKIGQDHAPYVARVMRDTLEILEKDIGTAYAFLASIPIIS